MSRNTSLTHICAQSARNFSGSMFVIRAFSTSTPRTTTQPPPESPLSVLIPKPPLSEQQEKLPPARGHLPVPRQVFHPSEGDRKVTGVYLKQTAPEPSNAVSKEAVRSGSAEEWRRLMAATRRENLRTGLQDLWNRKRQRESREAKLKAAKVARDNAAVNKPQPRAEIYTQSTVLQSTALDTTVHPDPFRLEKAAESRQRTLEKLEKERLARRNHLMKLYIKATKFIVNETQLQHEIDRVFDDNYWTQQEGKFIDGNAWASWGAPLTVEATFNQYANSNNSRSYNTGKSVSAHTALRQKQVASEMLGGKI